MDDRKIHESELLMMPGVAIILAEPGAGKTALLASLAKRFGTTSIKASIFERAASSCTVIDAFDEVARIDTISLRRTLLELRHTGASRIILSSRSGEWSDSDTHLLRDITGNEPIIVRLVPFDVDEQAQLFRHRHPNVNFDLFRAEVARHDLTYLLGNPEFLNLFADAFVQADGKFINRHAIFSDAVRYLARENNASVRDRDSPTTDQRIAWTDEVFARLLLSGADGVSMTGPSEGPTFPRLGDIGLSSKSLSAILDTRLFRPAAGIDRHEPVHRIVAEHCAARALVQRINNPANTFTVRQCLSLIAPNGTIRDDLRGLLGWMAALGSQETQDAAIDTDAYAVLSNGDPSCLTLRSRHRLLKALYNLNTNDPFFRRVDRWRSFSTSGFFTPDIVEAVRPLIIRDSGGDLRALLLELLSGSQAVITLRSELEAITLDDGAASQCRRAALDCLLKASVDTTPMIDSLILSGTNESLRLTTEIVTHVGIALLPQPKLLELLLACSNLYPKKQMQHERIHTDRYFIRIFVSNIDSDKCLWLLDRITKDLVCTCAASQWECYCRDGVSKIVGYLLDRYFKTAREDIYDPQRVWLWLKKLHFHRSVSATDSLAVGVLHGNDTLRHAIQRLIFDGLATQDAMIHHGMNRYAHSGLSFLRDDIRSMVDYAFVTDNIELWDFFVPSHRFYAQTNERGPHDLRQRAHWQARQKPVFLARWALRQRTQFNNWKKTKKRYHRSRNRWRLRELKHVEAAVKSLRKDQKLIEGGQHRGWLLQIARYYLYKPASMDELTHGLINVETALRNYLRIVDDNVPTLEQCAQSGVRDSVVRLHAACFAEFRGSGSLSHVDRRILAVVRTDIGGYSEGSEAEWKLFEEAVDTQLFRNEVDADAFVNGYIEAQLASRNEFSDVSWLERKPQFHFLLPTRPLEWLRRFPVISQHVMSQLFDLSVRHGNRADLIELIQERCIDLDSGMLPHKLEAQRHFWFFRHFWFLDNDQSAIWEVLDRDPNLIFELAHIRSKQRSNDTAWPDLGARKIALILNTFVDRWPPVPLPSSWGTNSPKRETAYRYLSDVIYAIGRDMTDAVFPVLNRLLADPRMTPFYKNLRSILAASKRARSHRDFAPPNITAVKGALDQGCPASVEHMRCVMVEFLNRLQDDLTGGDLDLIDQFYDNGQRLGENAVTKRIVNWLRPRLEPLGFLDVIEHQLADGNRCDITVTIQTPAGRRMLVIEVKGQWNVELFSAARRQLAERYAIHPTADEQGIYLILWYGINEKIAGRKNIENLQVNGLKKQLENDLPTEIAGRVDVVVLDLARYE